MFQLGQLISVARTIILARLGLFLICCWISFMQVRFGFRTLVMRIVFAIRPYPYDRQLILSYRLIARFSKIFQILSRMHGNQRCPICSDSTERVLVLRKKQRWQLYLVEHEAFAYFDSAGYWNRGAGDGIDVIGYFFEEFRFSIFSKIRVFTLGHMKFDYFNDCI